MATHSGTLAWKVYGWRSLVGCSPWGHEELDTTEWIPFHFWLSSIGEGNGNLLQCSCLENPRDGGAWWAAVYGVAQSRTRLKWLSSSSWEGLGAGREVDDRGWDGWMASLTRWMWVCVNSESWWWTGRPGVLWFMGLQIVGQDWVTELNWSELNVEVFHSKGNHKQNRKTTHKIGRKICKQSNWQLIKCQNI